MTVQNDEANPKRTRVVGNPQSRLDTVKAIEQAFQEFNEKLRTIDPSKDGGESMSPVPNERRQPSQTDRRRPRPSKPRRVYLLTRDGNTLDVYGNVKRAFADAQNLVGGRTNAGTRWKQSRPGCWWSATGNVEIKEFEVKD